VLEIQSAFSCATSKGRRIATPDPELEVFCMPVPREVRTKRKGRKLCLPGAPEAFEYGHSIVDDTIVFMEQLGDYSIGRDTAEEVLDYFRTQRGSLVRSMVCFSIRSRIGKLGVINIHDHPDDTSPPHDGVVGIGIAGRRDSDGVIAAECGDIDRVVGRGSGMRSFSAAR
jgi:hypothetical protein